MQVCDVLSICRLLLLTRRQNMIINKNRMHFALNIYLSNHTIYISLSCMNICSSDDDVQMMMRNANETKLELGVGKGYIKFLSNKNT